MAKARKKARRTTPTETQEGRRSYTRDTAGARLPGP